MECSSIQLNDLPDEILVIIFKKLNNIDLLYSLIGVNKQLNEIVHDSVFTSCLTLFGHLTDGCICPLSELMLDRFCSQILPEIHHKINRLDLEPLTMERVLLSADYPNLSGLGIYNIELHTALNLLIDETLMDGFKNQISSLVIETIDKQNISSYLNTRLFECIVNMFINLKCLNFNSAFHHQRLSFAVSPPTMFSSTLLELHVKVLSVDECLYLLDGRFSQLQAFYIDIGLPLPGLLSKINKPKLPNLRCFSLHCHSGHSEIDFYDEVILLLRRMPNLQQLGLYLSAHRTNRFIDGNDLKQNIINYMPLLNRFHFDFRSTIFPNDQIDLPSNEDILDSFKDFSNNEIISCVNYFPEAKKGYCHTYSYPFISTSYENIANNFSGGIFTCVRRVSLFDEHPFEHKFFARIAESFPFMRCLTITNRKPQNDKQCKKLISNTQDLLLITYPNLKYVNFNDIHDDYVEQFLLDIKTCLPYGVDIYVNYETLKRVTHNFRRKATQINCSKVTYQCYDRITQFPKHFKNYFRDTKNIF